MFAEGQTVGHAKLFGGAQGSVPLVGADQKPILLMIPRNATDRIIARIIYRGPVQAPVEKGQKIGVLKIWRGERIALETPLEAAESVEAGSMPRRALDAATEWVGGLLRSSVKKL